MIPMPPTSPRSTPRRFSAPRLAPWPFLLFLALLAGCGGDAPPAGDQGGGAPAPDVQAAAEKPPLDPAELAPVIREVAPSGVAPSRIAIEFARRVVGDDRVGKAAGDGTELRIEPPVDGELRFTSPSTLSFLPAQGFAPDTRYEVELVTLETDSGVLEAPEAGRWSRVFETPPFDFVRFSLGGVEYPQNRASVELVFSAAVDPLEVGRRTRASVVAESGGTTAEPRLRFERGDAPHTVRAVVASPQVRPGARVELSLAGGVPSAADPERRARAADGAFRLERGPETRVVKSYRAEGTNGFYVQVICDDSAVDTRRYYWDREIHESFQLSGRCLLDEADAAAGIHFEPPVDFSIAPSGGGFRIFGDFARGAYQMRIEAGVRTVDGGMLHSSYDTEIDVPARSPSLRLVAKGRYLPRSAWTSLPVRHLNVRQAQLQVRHVPPENLVFWMSDDDESAGERTSNLIVEKKLAFGGEVDVETTTYVDLQSLVPAETRGLLEVRLVSGDARDTARLLLTDLHLVAKRAAPPVTPSGESREGTGAVHGWALDVDTVAPESGVELQLVRKSGYVLARCTTTGRQGGCTLEPAPGEVDPSPPFAVVARRGDDLTYLKFDELEAEVQEARIAGDPYRGEQAYRAAVYSDRGVYRPGETAHLAAIVRDDANLAPPSGMPVQARLIDPQGKTLKSTALLTNGAGYLTLDVPFADFATTGRHELRLHVAERQIGQYRFQVEEFVPERMRVEARAEEGEYRLGDEVRVAVAARYLFGGVPSGHRVEVACELAPASFDPPQNANFHYGVWLPEDQPVRPLDFGTVTAELGEEGTGVFACPGSGGTGPSFRGPAQLVARASVFESGSGRTTVGRATAPIHPERFYVGLQTGSTKVEAGNELKVEGVTVDWLGQPVEDVASVRLQLIRLEPEYGWYYDEQLGHETYRRYLQPVVELTETVPVTGGAFQAIFEPPNDGASFLVRATAGDARTELQLAGSGGWYYWGPQESEVDQTPRPGRPTWLALSTPDEVRVGERFPVSFNAPYGGRVLLTAETDRVLESEWIDVDAGETVWFFELDDFVPNVYLTAFLVKDPHLDSAEAFLPDRAFGVRSARVVPVEYTHQLALDAPEEVRSGSRLTVRLDLGELGGDGESTYATVAAVDEGILSLTDFESPDPLRDIFTRRALGVETFETVGWTVLVPPATSADTVGGDGAGALGRVQPVKPVALWSELLEVPESGEVEVSFDLPQYRGELRVMAVTAGPQRMGHADARVTVRDPLVVQATLPRFLTNGDELRIPVFVTNLSGQRREVEVRLESEALQVAGLEEPAGAGPPVEIIGPRSRTLTLDDGAGDTAVFRAVARRSAGGAELRAVVRSGELESVEEVQAPLLPAGPKSRTVRRIPLEEGSHDLTPYLEGWQPLSERSTFWVTANPYGEVLGHLKYLVRYPYGCIEQTTSTTRPLLYLGQLVPRIDPELLEDGTVEEKVQSGIDRLLSMQTPSGGFSYWPGAIEPVFWGTAYATHLLLDARDLGYPVPEGRIDEALSWMERQITNYYEAGRDDLHGRDAEPYMHYVLARAGRARKGRIEKLIRDAPSAVHHQARENLYLLRAALHLAGDRRYEKELRNPDLSAVSEYRSTGWSFYSDRRMRGLMLATFVDLFGRDPGAERLANLVAEALRGRGSYYTTQELAWGITGLGKYVEIGADDFAPPVLRAGGRRIAPEEVAGESPERTFELARASEYDELTLEIPEKGEGRLFLVLSSQGVREDPEWRTGGEGLRVRRNYRDAGGREIDPESGGVRLGDLVFVELTIRNDSPEKIHNVALVDRIPAGWEIENPRLGRDGTADWVDPEELWQVDHLDLRDDRLEVFGHLDRGEERRVVYAVRAVTAGRFTVPTVEAEAMYDPRIWAREAPAKAQVAGPWGEE